MLEVVDGAAVGAELVGARLKLRRGRRRREEAPSPTRQQLIDVVIRLAEQEGEAALNMRRVAAVLGVSPKLLYSHVSGKDELFELAAGAILATMELPLASLPWAERLTAILRAGRALMQRYSGIAERPLRRGLQSSPSPSIQRVAEAIVCCLTDAGLPQQQARRFLSLYEAFLLGELMIYNTRVLERRDGASAGHEEIGDAFETGLNFVIAGIRSAASDTGNTRQ
jgi:TetR/AcrR family tetracycline transcriptional repressor